MNDAGPILHVALLGSPEARWAGNALLIPRRQTRALLYRLATDMRPASRDQLCALFWPDAPDAAARRSLTHLLTHLRRALPDPGLLQADGERIALDPARSISDTADLAGVLADERPPLDALRRAAELLRSPFLAGFSLPGCPEFAAWADGERARWERLSRELLATLAERAAAEERFGEAIWAAQRGLELDELDEALHRRLIALYAALGDRTAVERQYERCVAALERELGAPPLPATRAAYLAARDHPPALADRPAARAQIAAPVDTLIGRDQDLATLRALLGRPDIRLLTLTGPGGVGKTRLARAIAAELADTYADGTVFTPLAPIQNPDLVPTAIAAACGLRDTSDRDALAHLLDVLRQRQALLVLDNMEHLIAAAPLVNVILAAAPGLRVIVTSRALLRLADEHVYLVPALPVADDPAGPAPAVELFLARAQAVAPGQRLGAGDRAAIATICARLDGLPLAIELAAARTRVLTPHALLARLGHRFELLVGGPRDRPARQQTLLATLDWSYHLLDRAERQALRRLAICVGGFSLELAEQMVAAPGALELLERLADQSPLYSTSQGSHRSNQWARVSHCSTTERRVEIDPEIVGVLDPNAEAEERRWQVALAGNRRSSFHRGLHGSETSGMADEPHVAADRISHLSAATQIERDDGSEALEHALGRRVRRVCRQAWIPDTHDQRVLLKPLRKQHGRLLSSL